MAERSECHSVPKRLIIALSVVRHYSEVNTLLRRRGSILRKGCDRSEVSQSLLLREGADLEAIVVTLGSRKNRHPVRKSVFRSDLAGLELTNVRHVFAPPLLYESAVSAQQQARPRPDYFRKLSTGEARRFPYFHRRSVVCGSQKQQEYR